jgi:hypothetical protein
MTGCVGCVDVKVVDWSRRDDDEKEGRMYLAGRTLRRTWLSGEWG